jgi:hypothetical protein
MSHTHWLHLRAVGWLERCVYDQIGLSSMNDVRRELNRLLSPEPVLKGLQHVETLMDAYCELETGCDPFGGISRGQPGFRRGFYEHKSLILYAFCRDVLGIRFTTYCSEVLDWLLDAAKSCAAWWPYRGFCVAAERPSAISVDEFRRLHHASDAALQFRDGNRFYMWHGTEVPESWIKNPDSIDPTCAFTGRSMETRLAGCEIAGWQRVLDAVEIRTLDKHEDPEIGELAKVTIPKNGTKLQALIIMCNSGKRVVAIVPDYVNTALGANAWTYELQPSDLESEKQVAPQGDVLFRRVPKIPDHVHRQKSDLGIVIARSATGHEHFVADPDVSVYREAIGRYPTFLRVDTEYVHVVQRPRVDPWGPMRLYRGGWEVRRQRDLTYAFPE